MIQPTLEINSSYINSNGDTVDNWMRADLTHGVKIVIKDKIKDSKDVGKVFTAYTNQFKLPASKRNNRIFKRFANHNVYEGFDARRKHSAIIKLNGVDFKKGYIVLNKVNLVDMLPESYDIQFYGELTSLKDIFGEYKLKDLKSLGDKYTHPYNDDNALLGLIYGYDVIPSSGGGVDIQVNQINPMFKFPLISNARGFEYSGIQAGKGFHRILSQEEKANDYVITDADRMNKFDLNPAMKLSMIFDAIQDSSDIFGGRVKFNTEWLFGGSEIPDASTLDELYIWLHNTKAGIAYGNSTGDSDVNVWTRWLTKDKGDGDWTKNEVRLGYPYYTDCGNATSNPPCPDVRDKLGDGYNCGGTFEVFHSIGEGNVRVSVKVYVDDLAPIVFTESGNLDPTDNISVGVHWALGGNVNGYNTGRPSNPTGNVRVEFEVEADSSINAIAPRTDAGQNQSVNPTVNWQNWFLDGNPNHNPYVGQWQDLPQSQLVLEVIPNKLLPDMKIIDFLSDLFKTYNLVAFEERLDDGTYQINIQSLDYYLGTGVDYDITKFIDISKSTVQRVSPYSVVEYKFPKPKTFLAINQAEITGDEFGSMTFNVDNFTEGEQSSNSFVFDGGKYKVEPKFEKMMYERITNSNDGKLTRIQWGWSANDNDRNLPEPVVGNPLLLYANRKTVAYVNEAGNILAGSGVNFIANPTISIPNFANNNVSVAFIPSNVSFSGENTLNFNAEFDEYKGEINENSLFANFHETYISGIYSNYARRQTLTAYLPPVIFTKLKLNDFIIMDNVSYRIDSMDINVTDAKTKLDLLRMTDYKASYEGGRQPDELIWNTISEVWELASNTWDDGSIKNPVPSYNIWDTKNFRSNITDIRYEVERPLDSATQEFSQQEIEDGTFQTWLGVDTYGNLSKWKNSGSTVPLNGYTTDNFQVFPSGVIKDPTQGAVMYTDEGTIEGFEGREIIVNYVWKNEQNVNNQRANFAVIGDDQSEVIAFNMQGSTCMVKYAYGVGIENEAQTSFPIDVSSNFQAISLLYSGGVVTRMFRNGVEQSFGASNAQGCKATSATFNRAWIGGRNVTNSGGSGKKTEVGHASVLIQTGEDIATVNAELTALYVATTTVDSTIITVDNTNITVDNG